MNILHISNGYVDSKVHSQLTKALDVLGVEQTVYCPVREKRLLSKNSFESKHVSFVYSYCIKPWYKYVYQYKRRRLFHDMKHKVDLGDFDVIHAATLFSDGGLALKAHEMYGTPYIVAVRNTDINTYIKRLRHTHRVGIRILEKASKIIFISKGEMEEFCQSEMVKPIFNRIKDKLIFQPNGIEEYFLQHISHEQRSGHDVLYVGDFSPNKNVVRLCEAVLKLRKEKGFENVRLVIVGGEKEGIAWKSDGLTQQMIDQHPEVVKALGKINDREKLSAVMRSCALFAMPSKHETFGLVYVEALSQNLPVIYTKGQGIDGIFSTTVGEGVDALSVEDIAQGIVTILRNPNKYSNKSVNFDDFKWSNIAQKYMKIYRECILK